MQRARFRGVLLDVDGTLVDSNDAHAHAWSEALAKFGHDLSFARARQLIGMGGDRLVEAATGLPIDTRANKRIVDARSEIFLEKWLPTVRPIQGSRALVLRLRSDGYDYALASAAKTDELAPLLEIADIADLVPKRTTSSDVEHSKPDPDTIEAALAKLQSVERSQAVMVGDTPFDVLAARRANVAIIGVTCGGWPAEALAGAIEVATGPAALAERFP
ncbi:MAG TPA: HAD family hydrolase [Kofleriaceae bacterium]|nr:HAD family hydrolase [Kofleriaceae bacterium]